MRYDDEALDRALMALPLEEPPPDLRAAILAATAYRPPALLSLGEAIALAGVAAAILWLVVAVAMGGGELFTHALTAIGGGIVGALSNLSTLAWLATGAATAAWLVFFTESQPAYAAGRRSKPPRKP